MSHVVKLVFLACVLVVTAKPMTKEERHALFSELTGKCKAKEAASDFDVQEFMERKLPSTRSGQCFRACVLDGVGIAKDGKLSVENTIKMAEMSGDQEKVRIAHAVTKECHSVGADDRCESLVQVIQCIENTAVAHGIDPRKDFMNIE